MFVCGRGGCKAWAASAYGLPAHHLAYPLTPPFSPRTPPQRIHKRIIDLHAPSEVVKSITTIDIESGVEVEVRVLSS